MGYSVTRYSTGSASIPNSLHSPINSAESASATSTTAGAASVNCESHRRSPRRMHSSTESVVVR